MYIYIYIYYNAKVSKSRLYTGGYHKLEYLILDKHLQ